MYRVAQSLSRGSRSNKKFKQTPFVNITNNSVTKLFKHKKNKVGIRIPDNKIVREIVRLLEHPILSSSVKDEDELVEYTTDPELIYEKFQDKVDIIVNGGFGHN